MRSSLVKVHDIRFEKAVKLLLLEDQEVSKHSRLTLPRKRSSSGICARRSVRCAKHLDATRCCHARKILPECAIIIPDQIFGYVPIWRCLPQLLRDPGIGRRSRHVHMDHLPRLLFNDEKGKQRTEEEIGHLQEITGPYPCRMIAQECFPGLSTRSFSGNLFHILLDGPFDFSAYPI
jgi:hypothetical protein